MDEKLIALTFDDGPNTDITLEVLDILEQNGVLASFFLIGQNINEETAKVAKKAFDMGHDIQNHSLTHSDMTKLTAEEILTEIQTTDEKIIAITGKKPTFFRPPFILTNDLLYETVDKTFICGIGCNDWVAECTAEERIATMKSHAKDGTMYLLHDYTGNQNTVEAIKVIIPWLKEQGFSFVTVSQMFEKKGVTPAKNVIYSTLS